jgi:hypothetical protein
MGSMLASNIVGHGFQQVKQKTIKLVFAASRSNSKDMLVQNQDNASEWSYITICRQLFQ